MYTIWFLHRVPETRADDFVDVVARAIGVFRRHGALGGSVYAMADPTAKYGCSAVEACVDVAPDEVLFAETAYFRDRAHYDQVMPLVDADPELEELYEVLISTIDIARTARAEFTSVVELVDADLHGAVV